MGESIDPRHIHRSPVLEGHEPADRRPEHRAVLVLTHYVGLPAIEVGRVLGIPPGTVYSRLHYGARRMRAALSAASSEAPTMAPQELGR